MLKNNEHTESNALAALIGTPSGKAFVSNYLGFRNEEVKDLKSLLALTTSQMAHIEDLWAGFSYQDQEQEQEAAVELIGRLCRLALFESSINSIAGEIDDEWIPLLVQYGVCTPSFALTLTRYINTEAIYQSDTLCGLAPFLSGELLHEAIEIADALDDPYSRHAALATLLPRLLVPEQKIAGLLHEIPSIKSKSGRIKIWVTLLPHLPKKSRATIVRKALQVLPEVSDLDSIAKSIMRLLPWLHYVPSLQLFPSLWKLVDLHFPHLSHLLINNTVAVPTRRMLRGHFAILAWFGVLDSVENQLLMMEEYLLLDSLCPYLPSRLRLPALEDALQLFRKVTNPYHRASGLAQLVPNFPPMQSVIVLNEALEAAREVEWQERRAVALVRVSRGMGSVEQARILEEAWPMLGDLRWTDGAQALTEMLPLLPRHKAQEYLATMLKQIILLDDTPARFVTAVLLDPKQMWYRQQPEIVEELLARSYGQALLIEPLGLAKVAPYLPDEERQATIFRLLAKTDDFSSPRSRSYAFRHLLPFVPPAQQEAVLKEASKNALSINYSTEGINLTAMVGRAEELSHLVAIVPESERQPIVDEALQAILVTYIDWQTAPGSTSLYGSDHFLEYIATMAPALSAEQALEIIRNSAPHTTLGDRWRLVALLLPKLAPREAELWHEWLLNEMLDDYQPSDIDSIYGMAHTCAHLAHTLSGEVQQQVINKALSTADTLKKALFRARAYLYIVPHLEGETQKKILEQVFELIANLPSTQQNAEIERFAKQITRLPLKLEAWACTRAIRLAATLSRQDLLPLLQAVAPRLRRLGGPAAGHAAAEAVMGVGEFFA
ncbi:MAG: hypothetical protein ACPGWR_05795 [Ardenticatenaceae bacterium]